MKIKQINIGLWWGAVKLIFQNVTSYIQYIILVFTGITAYEILRKWLIDAFNFNLSLWLFIGVIVLGIGVLVLFEYSASMPSFFKMWNGQWWKHGNPMKDWTEKTDERLTKIEEILNATTKRDN